MCVCMYVCTYPPTDVLSPRPSRVQLFALHFLFTRYNVREGERDSIFIALFRECARARGFSRSACVIQARLLLVVPRRGNASAKYIYGREPNNCPGVLYYI